MIDYPHLTSSAQKFVELNDSERINKIRADRWVGYPLAQKYIKKLESLLSHPQKQRMPNLLIIGPTNNGKSMIIEKFKRLHLPVSCDDYEYIPVLSMQMPSDPSIIRFYTALLASTGCPITPKGRLADLEQLALKVLRAIKIKVLIIDELHNILSGKPSVQREFLNVLRYIGNELKISLVGAGIKDAYLAIQSDSQLENRFEPMILPRWEANEEACSLLESFASSFPLKKKSYISSMEMAQYLLSRCEGTIGELVTLLTRASITAINNGEECINEKTLKMTEYLGPTLRKRQFERSIA